jgi:drug/metabolite transporter (DMT)-like permease
LEIVLKFVSAAFNPVQLTFTRFFIGGLFLVPYTFKSLREKHLSIKDDLVYFAFLGFLGIVISMGLYQLAVQTTKASVVAVLFSCNPVFVMILAYFLTGEIINTNKILALILEVIGTLIIINPFNTQLNVFGILLTIASTLTFALYGILGKRKCEKYGGITVTCFGFIFGSLELLILIALSHNNYVSSYFSINGLSIFSHIPLFTGYSIRLIPILLYIFIVNTGIGYACYFKSLEETSAQITSLVFFVKPILAPILALILLHEIIPLNMVVGIIFIFIGSLSAILRGLLSKRLYDGH